MDIDDESQKIITIYEALLKNSEGYDLTRFTTKIDTKYVHKRFNYRSTESAIIDSITSLLSLIRKRIESISKEMKTEKQTTFDRLEDYHIELSEKIEYEDGIISKIENGLSINEEIKKLRSLVYLIAKTLSIFVSEEIIQIEKLTDTTLKLRELGIIKSAELLESLTLEKMNNISKVTNVRSAFEQTLIAVLKSQNIKTTTNFFHNLDALAQNSLIEKALQKSFSKHYSFISKIIHAEIKASNENVLYGLNIILQIIWKILPIFKQKD